MISANGFTRSDNWFFLCVGILILVGSARAVITQQTQTRSKGGHVTHYSGRPAVVRGWIGIVIGAAMLVFGAISLI